MTGVKEYVKIEGIWQYTEASWYVDKKYLMSEPLEETTQTYYPGSPITIQGRYYQDWECIAHVHHWKTKLEEYCPVTEEWKCMRCGEITPENIQAMIKLYRPLKNV